jgi:hypothetical protein
MSSDKSSEIEVWLKPIFSHFALCFLLFLIGITNERYIFAISAIVISLTSWYSLIFNIDFAKHKPKKWSNIFFNILIAIGVLFIWITKTYEFTPEENFYSISILTGLSISGIIILITLPLKPWKSLTALNKSIWIVILITTGLRQIINFNSLYQNTIIEKNIVTKRTEYHSRSDNYLIYFDSTCRYPYQSIDKKLYETIEISDTITFTYKSGGLEHSYLLDFKK